MSAGPRVLYVSAVPDFKGGAEVVLRTMLANPLVEPVLAAPEEGPLAETATAMGVPVCYYRPCAMMRVHRPPRPMPILRAVVDAVRCAGRLRDLARDHRCAIIHTNGLKPHLLAALLGKMSGARTVIHLHDIPYRMSERLIWRGMTRRVDQLIMVSRACYPGAVLPDNVRVVANGIRPVLDALPAHSRSVPLRLGFVGRFHPNKGMDLLLDWFHAIRNAQVDATLLIRGRPDSQLPDYWAGIQRRIEAEGLAPFVEQQGWRQESETYRDLDVLLVPSNIPDPAPLVVMEAMSAGIIVAGYPAGGIPGMIEHRRTGILAESGVVVASELARLARAPETFAAMRMAAFETARTEFGITAYYRRLVDAYEAMLPTPADRRTRATAPTGSEGPRQTDGPAVRALADEF